MADPLTIEPDDFEILVARELRKAGFELDGPKRRARTRPDRETGDYTLELAATLRHDGEELDVLIGCVRQAEPVAHGRVDRLAEVAAGDGRRALLFATGGFDPEAERASREKHVALLRVLDGRAAYVHGGFGPPGSVPAWVPEFAAELVSGGPADATAARVAVRAGDATRILRALSPPPQPPA